MTDTAVHPYSSHAPVFSVDSRTEGALARDILRLDVEEGLLGLRTMVAHLQAIGPESDGSPETLSYLDGTVVDLGRSIEVVVGPAGGERRVFKGTISAVEVSFEKGGLPYVSVFAEDALMRLRMRERTVTYSDVSDADIVGRIADEHGLGSDAPIEGPKYPMVHQFEQSDLAFIRDRALRLDAEVWLDSDEVVHVADREQRGGVELVLVEGNELLAVRGRVDLAHQRPEVTMRGWNDTQVVPVSSTATAAVVAAEVAGGRTGPQVVADVFPDSALSRARRDVLDTPTAKAYADAEMRRRARSFVTVDGTTSGTPDLVPGTRLDLRRVARPFEGSGYRVVHARHSFDLTNGYRTRFRAERPRMGT